MLTAQILPFAVIPELADGMALDIEGLGMLTITKSQEMCPLRVRTRARARARAITQLKFYWWYNIQNC